MEKIETRGGIRVHGAANKNIQQLSKDLHKIQRWMSRETSSKIDRSPEDMSKHGEEVCSAVCTDAKPNRHTCTASIGAETIADIVHMRTGKNFQGWNFSDQ